MRRYFSINSNHSFELCALATLTSGEAGKNSAAWQDYTVGGTNSIRGWELASRIGKNQFISTLEHRYLILEPKYFAVKGINFYFGLSASVFADFGSAWDTSDQFGDQFIEGYGAGIRLLVPFVRIVRFDLAYSDSGTGLLIHIGAPEKPERSRDRVR